MPRSFAYIAVDTRAQGQSVDTLTSPLTYELFAADMKTLLDSLHIRQANVVGWSDGGNTGLLMAQRYPTYVRKLVTMGANLFPTTEAVDAKTLRQSEQARQTLAEAGRNGAGPSAHAGPDGAAFELRGVTNDSNPDAGSGG